MTPSGWWWQLWSGPQKVVMRFGQFAEYETSLNYVQRWWGQRNEVDKSIGLRTYLGIQWACYWVVSMVDIHLRKQLWVYFSGHAGVKGNNRADRLAGKATITSGLRLGRSEVLRILRHYLQAQSQGHHMINCLDKRCTTWNVHVSVTQSRSPVSTHAQLPREERYRKRQQSLT